MLPGHGEIRSYREGVNTKLDLHGKNGRTSISRCKLKLLKDKKHIFETGKRALLATSNTNDEFKSPEVR